MGDLVLTMDEVAPVMTKLAAGGIEVTGKADLQLDAGQSDLQIGARKAYAVDAPRRCRGPNSKE